MQLLGSEPSLSELVQGAFFYRIIDQFIDQSGANTESVFGGQFADDPGGLALKHDRRGLLSMANMGPDTNTSHFSIMIAPAPHLVSLQGCCLHLRTDVPDALSMLMGTHIHVCWIS